MAVHVYFRPGNGDSVEVWLETEKQAIGSFDPQALLDACPIDWDTLKVHPNEVTEAERAALQAYGVDLWNVLGKDKFTRMVAKQRQPIIFEVAEELADHQVLFDILWEVVYSDTRYGKYKPTFVARTHPFERANWNGSQEILQKFFYRTLLLSSRIYTLDEMDLLRKMYVQALVNLAPEVQSKIVERLMQPDMLPQAEEAREQYLNELHLQAEAIGLGQMVLETFPELVPTQLVEVPEESVSAQKSAYTDRFLSQKQERAALEKQLKKARKANNYHAQAEALYQLALYHYGIEEGDQAYREAIELAEKAGDTKLQIEISLMFVEMLKEEWIEAALEHDPDDESDPIDRHEIIRMLGPLVEVSVDLDDQLVRYELLVELGSNHLRLGEYEQALAYFEPVVKYRLKHKDYLRLEMQALAALRTIYTKLGEPAKARTVSKRLDKLDTDLNKQFRKIFNDN